ncbi:MAG: DUF998 domain-containing protein [Actinomycetota bacterium]|nr:DUF998 domain-containing protein [Actinomycetota bacterium]
MRRVPWWAVVSAAAAPVFLIGGWTVGAALQPAGYDPVTDTISALAAHGATDRWVMTTGLAGLGACHFVTALGLRPAGRPGRVALGVGGVATMLVAAFPQPDMGASTAHFWAATTGFVTLAVWPVLAWRNRMGLVTSIALLGTVGWFAVELFGKGDLIGLSERFVAGSQALCPLVAVVVLRRLQARAGAEPRAGRSRVVR